MDSVIRRIVVRGKVQGVGFRAFTQARALVHGVRGWVRNRSDGISVEAVLSGSAKDVAAMVDDCRRGPQGAHVIDLDVYEAGETELALGGRGDGFVELPTV